MILWNDVVEVVYLGNAAKKISNNEFNQFINDNLDFILDITPKNPIITKDDEWNEDFYDDYSWTDNE